jgi:hypothetical protein
VLVVAVLAVPWLVPSVPVALGNLVPDRAPRSASQGVVVRDPVVLPPDSAGFTGPRMLRPDPPSLRGVRLPGAGVPRRLSVARLSVRSQVVPISGDSGVLLPPSDPQLLGWWREGAVPGAAHGTAVLTGHTVHTGGGAFDNLAALVAGDRMSLRTERGTIRYVVGWVRKYRTLALARESKDIFRLGGPGRVVLITCSGWNGKIYLSNTVVVARPVP